MNQRLSNAGDNPVPWRMAWVWVPVILAFFLFLGASPFQEPDEGRYARIPVEMMARGDFITPTLDYVKYFEKPPLHYWLTACGLSVFGHNEFGARFFSALFALITVGAVYLAGRRLFSPETGLRAGLILAAMPGWLLAGRVCEIDPVLSSLLAWCLLSYLLFVYSPPDRGRWRWWFAFYLCAALATLAKGLIGFVFPCAIVGLHILVFRRFRLIRELRPWLGIPLYLAVTAPWFVAVSLRNPDFAWFFFVHEHFQRFTTEVHRRARPFWYFLPVLVVGTLPFLPWLFQALVRPFRKKDVLRHGEREMEGFLFIWIAFIFLFFSASISKLGLYILPVLPALALLLARHLETVEARWDRRGLLPRAHAWVMVFFGVLIAAGLLVSIVAGDRLPVATWPYSATAAGGLVLAWLLHRRFGLRSSLGPTVLLCFVSLLVNITGVLAGRANHAWYYSNKPHALLLTERYRRGDRVVHLRSFYRDVLFYSGIRPVVADYQGELSFGVERAPDRDRWFWSMERFLEEWRNAKTRFWVLVDAKKLRRENPATGNLLAEDLAPFHEVLRRGKRVLLTNR